MVDVPYYGSYQAGGPTGDYGSDSYNQYYADYYASVRGLQAKGNQNIGYNEGSAATMAAAENYIKEQSDLLLGQANKIYTESENLYQTSLEKQGLANEIYSSAVDLFHSTFPANPREATSASPMYADTAETTALGQAQAEATSKATLMKTVLVFGVGFGLLYYFFGKGVSL
jgi:hypothetical protein